MLAFLRGWKEKKIFLPRGFPTQRVRIREFLCNAISLLRNFSLPFQIQVLRRGKASNSEVQVFTRAPPVFLKARVWNLWGAITFINNPILGEKKKKNPEARSVGTLFLSRYINYNYNSQCCEKARLLNLFSDTARRGAIIAWGGELVWKI